MKKYLIVILVITVIAQLKAQEKSVKNLSFDVSGGIGHIMAAPSISLQNNLSYSINRYFDGELSLTYTNAVEGKKEQDQTYTGIQNIEGWTEYRQYLLYSLGLNAYFTPLKTSKHILGFGGGISGNYRTYEKQDFDGTTEVKRLTYSYQTQMGPSINIAAKYQYCFSNGLLLGLRVLIATFDDGGEEVLLSVGYRLPGMANGD